MTRDFSYTLESEVKKVAAGTKPAATFFVWRIFHIHHDCLLELWFFTSSRSLSQSPNMFAARTTAMRANPGKITKWGATNI